MTHLRAEENMLRAQLRCTGVLNQAVLDVFNQINREDFVPETLRGLAFADMQLPLGHEQVMLPPKEEAKVLQALAITKSDKILEIGTGFGFMTALMASLGHYVTSYDLFPEFTQKAQQNLIHIGIDNVRLITDDATNSWDKDGPFDVICCTAGLPLYPEALKQALAVGGRLVAFVGTAPVMQALLITRDAEETWSERVLFETVVPLMINAPRAETFKL